MITSSDSFSTYDLGKYYTILPQVPVFNLGDFIEKFNAKKVPVGFLHTIVVKMKSGLALNN